MATAKVSSQTEIRRLIAPQTVAGFVAVLIFSCLPCATRIQLSDGRQRWGWGSDPRPARCCLYKHTLAKNCQAGQTQNKSLTLSLSRPLLRVFLSRCLDRRVIYLLSEYIWENSLSQTFDVCLYSLALQLNFFRSYMTAWWNYLLHWCLNTGWMTAALACPAMIYVLWNITFSRSCWTDMLPTHPALFFVQVISAHKETWGRSMQHNGKRVRLKKEKCNSFSLIPSLTCVTGLSLDIKMYQVQPQTIYYPTIHTVTLTRLMGLLHATVSLVTLYVFVCSSDTLHVTLVHKVSLCQRDFQRCEVFTVILKWQSKLPS